MREYFDEYACVSGVPKTISVPDCREFSWYLDDETASASVTNGTATVAFLAPVAWESIHVSYPDRIEAHTFSITTDASCNLVLEYWV